MSKEKTLQDNNEEFLEQITKRNEATKVWIQSDTQARARCNELEAQLSASQAEIEDMKTKLPHACAEHLAELGIKIPLALLSSEKCVFCYSHSRKRDELKASQERVKRLEEALRYCQETCAMDDPSFGIFTPLQFASRLGLISIHVSEALAEGTRGEGKE